MAPQISNVIAKLYTVKSAYEQVISNMGRQITQFQQHQTIQQSYMQQTENHYAPKVEPPLSATSQPRVDNLLAGTGGSNNKCKFCKGNGYAPSSQSVSDRQTYAGGSARDKDTKLISSGREQEKSHGKSVQQPIKGPDHVVINLNMDQNDPYQEQPKKKSDSFRKVFQ